MKAGKAPLAFLRSSILIRVSFLYPKPCLRAQVEEIDPRIEMLSLKMRSEMLDKPYPVSIADTENELSFTRNAPLWFGSLFCCTFESRRKCSLLMFNHPDNSTSNAPRSQPLSPCSGEKLGYMLPCSPSLNTFHIATLWMTDQLFA